MFLLLVNTKLLLVVYVLRECWVTVIYLYLISSREWLKTWTTRAFLCLTQHLMKFLLKDKTTNHNYASYLIWGAESCRWKKSVDSGWENKMVSNKVNEVGEKYIMRSSIIWRWKQMSDTGGHYGSRNRLVIIVNSLWAGGRDFHSRQGQKIFSWPPTLDSHWKALSFCQRNWDFLLEASRLNDSDQSPETWAQAKNT
jgi:hypothetical protein